MEDILTLSATELAEEIRHGNLSARETVEAHIRRIETVNGDLNALVIPLFSEARAQAKQADEKLASRRPVGPLHGVPITIKEQYRVAGTQTTLGARNQIGNVYSTEGPLVQKLRQAGAIILGKTNIIQTLAGFESDNRVYGRSNNPWNLARTPGGSSGGEAALIAARGSALGLAGDFGGSTRIPAHFCGLHGLKPTTGRLTNDDFPTGLLDAGQEIFLPQPGPIARTVSDLQLAMAVLAETSLHPTFDLVPPVPWPDPKSVRVETLRIGFYTDNGLFPASPALRRAVEEAAKALLNRGATVDVFQPPDPAEALRIFLKAVSAAGGKDLKRLLGKEKPIPQVAGMVQGLTTPRFILKILQGIMALRGAHYLARMLEHMGTLSAEEYQKLTEARNRYRTGFIQSMSAGGFDAILCPPFALPAVLHGSSTHLFPALSYAFTYNILGAPAGVVAATRVGPGEESDRAANRDPAISAATQVEKDSAGLPVGVQVVARHWREDIVLAVMEALEQHFRALPEYPDDPYAGRL